MAFRFFFCFPICFVPAMFPPPRGGTIRIPMHRAHSPAKGMFQHSQACFGIGMRLRSFGIIARCALHTATCTRLRQLKIILTCSPSDMLK